MVDLDGDAVRSIGVADDRDVGILPIDILPSPQDHVAPRRRRQLDNDVLGTHRGVVNDPTATATATATRRQDVIELDHQATGRARGRGGCGGWRWCLL